MLKRYLFLSVIWAFVMFFCALPALAEMIVDTAWVRRYNGPGNSHDVAAAIAIDGSGNVYVTGPSWDNATLEDYVTIKYYPNGDTAWVRRYNGPGNAGDYPFAIAVAGYGNVCVSGGSSGSGTGQDYATIKYYPDGDTAWVRRYNGPGNSGDHASAIAVDSSANVYVTGPSTGSWTNYDYATIRYYPNGDTVWMKRYNAPGNDYDDAFAIAVDSSGNVYVTGGSVDSGPGQDYATIKYYPDGDTAWVRRYNGPGNSEDWAVAIEVDGHENVYVTGYSYGSGTVNSDYTTIKYYPNGDTAWVRRYNGPGNSDDYAVAIAVDGYGNVYVTGRSMGSGPGYDYATIKYYANGDTAWLRRYNGPGDNSDGASAIAVDGAGNVYVTGGSVGSGPGQDYATLKYYANGDTAWLRTYNGPGNEQDNSNAIVVDGYGNVYVTGGSLGSGTGLDYTTIKYFQAPRGDANRDGIVSIGDIVYLINFLYKEGPPPNPFTLGDANCNGFVTMGDFVYLITYLYKGGPAPDCE